ncbi:hypothetical protein LPUS_02802 [Lasallia pustulata]|uniref:Uncharacterized protein n=1 Tax=Lasallia pustulata TaxID=136370 RepID=A0A1W5CTE3_9LECA|nr:hypothetical protein LPUS_02802 [Lasallia pustulata]
MLGLAFSLEYHTPRILESKVSARAKGLDQDADQDSVRSGSTVKGDANFTPEYAFYRKRLSINIQHKWLKHLNHLHGSSVKPEDTIGPAQIHDDHTETSSSMGRQHVQDAVSSENTILIVEKTLLDGSPIFQAEAQWKQLWSDSEIPLSPISTRDSTAALELLQAIVRFSFNKISDWRGYIKVMGSHISRLEEQIYDKPEDDSKAKELWSTSKQLLEMEKLLISQTFLIKVVQDTFISPATAGPDTVEKDWLKDLWTDLEELRNNIQEDLIKAVTQMVDLVRTSSCVKAWD